MSDTGQGMSAEEIAEHNDWWEKREAALRREFLLDIGLDPDSWDGLDYEPRSVEGPVREPMEEPSWEEMSAKFPRFETIPHPCENILKKLEGRIAPEQIDELRNGAFEAAFDGIEFGKAPASPEERKRLQDAENAEIHRLHHLTKETAQHAQRGGGRPTKTQRKRLAGSFTEDVAEQVANSEPWEDMVKRVAEELFGPPTPEQIAKLSPLEQWIHQDKNK